MIIPLYDNNPTRTFPYVTLGLIIVNLGVFIYELSLGMNSPALAQLIFTYGATPQAVAPALVDLDLFSMPVLTIFTSIFIHASWLHVGGNLLYLWIFGNNVEDYFGHLRFLVFYIFAGLIATLAHVFFNLGSTIPSIGASGAIAGVLGAYLILYPRAQVTTIVVVFLRSLPAAVVLGMWIFFQLFSGVASIDGGDARQGGVAWFAHIGGFAAGVLAALVIKRP